MPYYDEAQDVKPETVAFSRYSIRLWIVLSLVLSLAAVGILSKKHLVDHRWLYVAALIVPLSVTLYFRNRIVLFGPFVYVSALLGMLAAGVLFGI
jgi:hypothetical protein